MTLKFSKNSHNDSEVTILDGTESRPFSYIELVKSSLNKDKLELDFSSNYNEDEKKQITQLINEISKISDGCTESTVQIE